MSAVPVTWETQIQFHLHLSNWPMNQIYHLKEYEIQTTAKMDEIPQTKIIGDSRCASTI